ncbi:MAG: HAD family hydrolase [Candidatus Polarisedimenticolia bacterium]
MTFKAILFDLDGTLTPVRSSWQHIHEKLEMWTGRADRYQQLFLEGRIDYEEFCRLDALEWKGLPSSRLEAVVADIGYRPGLEKLLETVRARGYRTGIVSTGLTMLAHRVRGELGFDDAQANELEVVNGEVSGRVRVHVPHGHKDVAVRRFCERFGLNPHEVIAVGDTAGDISMFQAVGYAIAFDPVGEEPGLAAHATVHEPDLGALAAALPLTPGVTPRAARGRPRPSELRR